MRIIILIGFLGFALTAMGQSGFDRYITVSWDVLTPLSNTSFIKQPSPLGFYIGYREKINEHFFIGGDLNSATLREHTPRQTYHSSTGDITTDFYKYVVVFAATVSGEYYFTPDKRLVPFAGLGLGANYNSYSLYYNVYSAKDNGWGVLIRPQAGMFYRMGKQQSWALLAALHLDYSTASNAYFNYQQFATIGFRVGIVVTKLFD